MSDRGKLVLLIAGALLTVLGAAIIVTMGMLAAMSSHRDQEGFATAPERRFATVTYALVSDEVDLGCTVCTPAWLVRAEPGTSIRVSVQSSQPRAVFIGIAAAHDVDAYMDGAPYDVIGHVRDRVPITERNVAFQRPTHVAIWTASASGSGRQTITWRVRAGRWKLVIMNADANRVVDVAVRIGINAPWAGALLSLWITLGVIAFIAGIGAILWGGALPLEEPLVTPATPYPVNIRGRLDEPLSRWLWLVKWFLAIPHALVLVLLWVAFGVLTIGAWLAIIVSGRYPQPMFATNVGIMRWSWRVGFYAYSALATDRYPPFTLRQVEYPATLTVAYPEHLSRGLALVKWWLLAIPHYMLIAIFSGTSPSTGTDANGTGNVQTRGGLLPLLVLFVGIALLFTGRYPRGLFDLIMGLHRWIYRVIAYVCLMRDEYPPFRVDLGGDEQSAVVPATAIANASPS